MKSVEIIETLMRLGLSTNQAKIYLALTLSGPTSVKEVSRNAKVPRENVYRAMPALFEMGLIKKSISSPSVISATPLPDGCSLLLNRKRSELYEIGEFIKEIPQMATIREDEQVQEDENQFALIPEVAVIKMEQLMAEKAKESIVGMVPISRLPTETPRISVWKKRANMGVKCKILLNRFNETKDNSELVDQLCRTHNFEVRYVTNPLDFTFTVYDDKETICDVSERNGHVAGRPRLWSNNKILVGMKLYIFDTLWDSSTEIEKNAESEKLSPHKVLTS